MASLAMATSGSATGYVRRDCCVVHALATVADCRTFVLQRIIDPAARFWEAHGVGEFMADRVIDCDGGILCPGFIDVQVRGAGFYSVVSSNNHNQRVRVCACRSMALSASTLVTRR